MSEEWKQIEAVLDEKVRPLSVPTAVSLRSTTWKTACCMSSCWASAPGAPRRT